VGRPYDPKDFYFRKAKDEGRRARSAFKIEEIGDRFRLFRKGMAVLDLGSAPGGWLQVMAERVVPGGVVVGVDLARIAPLGDVAVKTSVLDIRAEDFFERLRELHPGAFDLLTSDLAPKTSGIREADEARSLELAGLALRTAQRVLRPGGNFVCKVFMGGGFEGFLAECERAFEKTRVVRPEATRERSREHYVVGLSLRKTG
jgi:23S rRNA (uridine2552-2'-O)-methyltransferase